MFYNAINCASEKTLQKKKKNYRSHYQHLHYNCTHPQLHSTQITHVLTRIPGMLENISLMGQGTKVS